MEFVHSVKYNPEVAELDYKSNIEYYYFQFIPS